MFNLLKLSTLVFVLLIGAVGCRVVEYSDPMGRMVKVSVVGFDTKIGSFTATSPDGIKVTFTNLDSNDDTALNVVNQALSKIPSTLPVVP